MATKLAKCFVLFASLFSVTAVSSPPNIVVVMSDDQDYRLGSLQAQPAVNKLVIDQGIFLENHFVTIAQCCPSRTSFLRGQHGHNSNMTHVAPPGGGYDKFLASGENEDYLPHWLKSSGYNTEYLGKFMNGLNLATYPQLPKGWDHIDVLVEPYIYEFNNVVMSADGGRPVYYEGYHQTDVIRAKALSRIEYLSAHDNPFYLQVAPASPHSQGDGPTVPLIRHMYDFNDAKSPRVPNFNPPGSYQNQKPSFLKDLPLMNDTVVNYVDWQYKSRLQALRGVDEIVEDVVELLEKKGILETTYVIYTTDNGFHCGNHRRIGGKGFSYLEDTNIPMAIRGPGIRPRKSLTPSTHVDMARVPKDKWPVYFDGRSLLGELTESGDDAEGESSFVSKEIISVEFWGSIDNGAAPDFSDRQANNSYKSVRIVGEDSAWLFSRWCTGNDTELYNTIDDPYELTNLAINPDENAQRLIDRLNGLLLITKSCTEGSCRNPWATLPTNDTIHNLDQALHPKYDAIFNALPSVGFQICMDYQEIANEIPFYPPSAADGLGQAFRNSTDNFVEHKTDFVLTPGNKGRMGTLAQRHTTLQEMMATARNLTDKEIGPKVECYAPRYNDSRRCGI